MMLVWRKNVAREVRSELRSSYGVRRVRALQELIEGSEFTPYARVAVRERASGNTVLE